VSAARRRLQSLTDGTVAAVQQRAVMQTGPTPSEEHAMHLFRRTWAGIPALSMALGGVAQLLPKV